MPKHKESEYVQICPKCKSADTSFDTQSNTLQAIGMPGMQRCNACGYLAQVFPEVAVAKLKDVRSKMPKDGAGNEKQPLVDISYGKFIVKAMWKIEAPLVIILSLYGFYLGFWPSIFFLLVGLWMAYITYFKKVGSL